MKNFCFDFARLHDFDLHVRQQLPWYDLVLDALEFLTAAYLTESGTVYDIGSGTGNYYQRIASLLRQRSAKYIGIEKAGNMHSAHKRLLDDSQDRLYNLDVRDYQFTNKYDVCVVNLMLMFLPYQTQMTILDRLLLHMSQFGILLIIEKDLSSTCTDAYLRYTLERLTMYLKVKQGAAKDKVLDKELALLGVQRAIRSINIGNRYMTFEWFRLANFKGVAITHA